MKVVFRIPKPHQVDIQGRRRVSDLAKELGFNLESHLVIRGDDLLTRDAMVEDTDTIEVRPAISGG